MCEYISKLKNTGYFNNTDIQFAEFINEYSNNQNNDILLLSSALTSNFLSKKHICFLIEDFLEKEVPEELKTLDYPKDPKLWEEVLKKSNIVGSLEESKKPLILFKGRLYLGRYFTYEKKIADHIKKSIEDQTSPFKIDNNTKDLLFPLSEEKQREAIEKIEKSSSFFIVSGGPGTGKTFFISGLLYTILNNDINFALAAPTGKAAARMSEAVKLSEDFLKEKLKDRFNKDIFDKIITNPGETIHRLLGFDYKNSTRHNKKNPLPHDLVIIDEASMIDTDLMTKLIDALGDKCKLILIGDKDQLSSVEAGSVFADLCESSSLDKNRIEFIKNYRIQDSSPEAQYLFDLKEKVNRGELPAELKKITENDLEEKIRKGYKIFIEEKDPSEALKKFNNFRILCAVREGDYGVSGLNERAEEVLNIKKKDKNNEFYESRPILILKNDKNLKLFNGDIGIIKNGLMWIEIKGKLVSFPPTILPLHQTAFAMTIHKSQGSEFDNVVLVLPKEMNPVLTRELLYTGITRAKKSVEILECKDEIIKNTIEKKTVRYSGLIEMLGD